MSGLIKRIMEKDRKKKERNKRLMTYNCWFCGKPNYIQNEKCYSCGSEL